VKVQAPNPGETLAEVDRSYIVVPGAAGKTRGRGSGAGQIV
jgi:hypothetical protein